MSETRPDAASAGADYLDWRENRRISEEEIFTELIKEEVRTGRLTAARRRRLIRYAAHLQISAVDVGNLIADARRTTDTANRPAPPRPVMKLVTPPPARVPITTRIGAIITAAIAIDVLVLWLIF